MEQNPDHHPDAAADASEPTTKIMMQPAPSEEEEFSAEQALAALPVKPRDRYKFLRTIGFGGMKTVLLVRDQDTMRNVAMALMPDYRERPPAMVKRFIQEARITARLEHPNIVSVHDIGVDTTGIPYFTMRYLQGATLAGVLRKLKHGDPEAMHDYKLDRLLLIFRRVCNAIAFAHSQNVIHLDLKPENIHVSDFGDVQVLDWGLARFVDDEPEPEEVSDEHVENMQYMAAALEGKTIDGVAKGTPGFMAPEQAAGKNREKDERTDIYALGCILYTILTFESPLVGLKPREALKAAINGRIQAPSEVRNPIWSIPAALEAICLKAMERYPANRYQSVAELLEDIRQFTGGYAPKAAKAGPVHRFVLWIRRNWSSILLVVFVLAVLAILFLYWREMISFNL